MEKTMFKYDGNIKEWAEINPLRGKFSVSDFGRTTYSLFATRKFNISCTLLAGKIFMLISTFTWFCSSLFIGYN